jgi:hypothetical protein
MDFIQKFYPTLKDKGNSDEVAAAALAYLKDGFKDHMTPSEGNTLAVAILAVELASAYLGKQSETH